MADSLPTSVVTLLKDIVGALASIFGRLAEIEARLADLQSRDDAKDAQIAELQSDRTTLLQAVERLTAAVTDLQGHAETVVGESGIQTQLGDLNELPALQEQLAAAMPAPVEAAPVATAQDPAIQAAA